jgi:hypothetical protein
MPAPALARAATAETAPRRAAEGASPAAIRPAPPLVARAEGAVPLLPMLRRKPAEPVLRAGVQAAGLRVSSPGEPAEREAEAVAHQVLRLPQPAPRLARAPSATLPRAAAAPPSAGPGTLQEIRESLGGGTPLPQGIRGFMEPRFRADFGGVRIHAGERAARLAARLGARAFTFGRHIFFGRGEWHPETQAGAELLAHELVHTVQQGETIQRQAEAAPRIAERSAPGRVQRLGISDALDYFADKANLIPGFRMFTILIGVNPINMSRVERSAANILRAIVEFLPGGGLIVQALDRYGVFDKAGAWVEQRLETLGLTASAIRRSVDEFLDSLGWRDIFHLGDVWDRAKRIFTEPIRRIIDFAGSLLGAILDMVKEAVLRPLAELASRTPAWDLLCAVLGRNPITGEAVPRTADTLIGGFMTLIGQQEVWENLKRANAVGRAWAWFQATLSGVLAFVTGLPGLFLSVLRSLGIADLVHPIEAFKRVAGVFGSFFGRFFAWAGGQVLGLLQIIFEVLAPAVVPYLRKAAATFQTIIRDPIRFIRYLVQAGIQGFRQFARNFLTHLRTSLVEWLTGTLGGAVYIPQSFSLGEIVKFVLSVLGLTWQNIRGKLVRVIGEPAVSALEAGFDIVVTLVREGPAAAWQKILEGITNLREMVIEQVMAFVRSRIVQAAIETLLTSLNPAGAFIQAIIAIYNTIMFFVERLKQIGRVAAAFVDSIAAIASGAIGAAADRVERTMAGLLTLVISFLARIAKLGSVSEAVLGLINRVRAPIDRALDRVVEWIVAQARRLGRLVAGRGRPVTPPPAPASAPPAPVGIRITMSGVGHMIEAVPQGGAIRLFMASRRETLREKLNREAALWANSENPELRSSGQALAARLTVVRQREDVLSASYSATADSAQRHALAVAGVNEIGAALVATANEFGIVIEDEDIPRATPFHASGLNLGRATQVHADPLTVMSLRPMAERVQFAPGGFLRFPGRDRYAAGHLLADTMGGPIVPGNLALVSRGTNGRFSSREARVRNALRGTKRIPEPRTILRYEVSCAFESDPQGQMEDWMRRRYAARLPQARFGGVGAVIMQMVGRQEWNTGAIDKHLGLAAPQPLGFYDRTMWRAAKLYLPKEFTISIRTYAGTAVQGDSFPNHIGGMQDPPDQ